MTGPELPVQVIMEQTTVKTAQMSLIVVLKPEQTGWQQPVFAKRLCLRQAGTAHYGLIRRPIERKKLRCPLPFLIAPSR